jgi:hypothetical protein
MTKPVGLERRRAERVSARLNLNVHLRLPGSGGSVDDLETLNVSSSGVYFKSSRFIEPMTKLALRLEVPTERDDPDVTRPISCEGIVVRTLPEQPDESVEAYEVAVFFTTIDAESLHNLESYITNLLA